MPGNRRALRNRILIVPHQVLVLLAIHSDVVVISTPFVRAESLRVALAQDAPVDAGRGEVVAWAEGGLEEEDGGCGGREGGVVLGGGGG